MATHSLWTCLVATVGLLWGVTVLVSCNEESKLIGDLFRGYNKSICPAVHPTDKVEVQVKLILTNIISLRTWAIKHSPARKLINSRYTPDDLEYQEISFNLVIQREPLFYIINIILPCSLISLVVLAYLLPAQDWGQKLTVSISVLLAQTVFLFLIAQKDPETSLNVPLISKYLIFVMSVTTLIATNQIVVGTSPSAVPIPTPCPTQHLFLELVPQFLGMAPLVDNAEAGVRERRRSSFFGLMQRAEEYVLKQPRSEMVIDKQRGMASHDHLVRLEIPVGREERIAHGGGYNICFGVMEPISSCAKQHLTQVRAQMGLYLYRAHAPLPFQSPKCPFQWCYNFPPNVYFFKC